MERWTIKLIVFVIIFVTTFLSTILPLKVSHYFQENRTRGIHLLSYCTCFGGGVFLAMYMLEMAPDAAHIVKQFVCEPHDIKYNISEFITACGFLLMLVSEIGIQQFHGRHSHGYSHENYNDDRTTEQETQCNFKGSNFLFNNACINKQLKLSCELLPNANCDIIDITEYCIDDDICNYNEDGDSTFIECKHQCEPEHAEINSKQESDAKKQAIAATGKFQINSTLNNNLDFNGECYRNVQTMVRISRTGPSNTKNDSIPLVVNIAPNTKLSPIVSIASTNTNGLATLLSLGLCDGLTPARSIGSKQVKTLCHHYEETKSPDPMKSNSKHASRSIILLLALSLHHVFEGLSLGLKTSTAAVWHMCICIVSHEVIISFSLGMQLISTFKSRQHVIIAAALCAIVSPIGIVLGMIIMETGGGNSNFVQIMNGLLQSIATGIFIYVTFFEILQDELNRPSGNSIIKAAAVISGFLVISALGLMPQEDDDTGFINIAEWNSTTPMPQ